MKTRAAVLRAMGLPGPYASTLPLSIETVELAPPGPGEVLLRMLAAGVCHSDLSVVDGSRPRVMPMVLGHEACGEVIETGPGVTAFRRGDRVVCSFVPGCGGCEPCTAGRPALCEPGARANVAGTLLAGTRRWLAADSTPIHHHLGVSGFAEHCVISERSAIRIDDDLAPEIAALFGCAVMTGVGAVVNTARVVPGDAVAIFGLGGVGLSALLGAAACGAQPLVAIDTLPAKLELARAWGATHTVLAATDVDVAVAIRDLTRGGAQHAIETSGHERAIAQAYAATRRGGTTVLVALPHPAQPFSVPAVGIVTEERTIRGSYMGSCVPARDIPRFVGLHRSGRLPVDRLLSHRLRLEELNTAFDRLAAGVAVRQIVSF